MLNLLDWKVYAVIKGMKRSRKHGKAKAQADLNKLAIRLNQQLEVLLDQMRENQKYKNARKDKKKQKVEVVITIDNKFDQQ